MPIVFSLYTAEPKENKKLNSEWRVILIGMKCMLSNRRSRMIQVPQGAKTSGQLPSPDPPVAVFTIFCCCGSLYNLIRCPSYTSTPYSSSMADNRLKRIFYRSQSPSPKPQPSIHQSGDNATITIQGSFNDVGRDQNNITYITNLGGTL